jgi:DNA-binding PadR family transcriptional regulator
MTLTLPMLQILLALVDEDRHGYGILLEIEERTAGRRLGTGTLYTALRRLDAKGLIEETEERPAPELDDARRRYYRITALGREAVRAEAARLATVVGMAREKEVLPR